MFIHASNIIRPNCHKLGYVTLYSMKMVSLSTIVLYIIQRSLKIDLGLFPRSLLKKQTKKKKLIKYKPYKTEINNLRVSVYLFM